MSTSLVTMMRYETVAPLINHSVMVDGAWRATVGLKPATYRRSEPEALNHEERMTLSVLAGWTYTHDGRLRTGDLVTVLQAFIDAKRDAVMRVLRDLEEAGFVCQVQCEDLGTVYHWYLKSPALGRKLDQLADLLAVIDKVIAVQRSDPENPEAGKDLLPEEFKHIYYNILTRRNERRAEQDKQ